MSQAYLRNTIQELARALKGCGDAYEALADGAATHSEEVNRSIVDLGRSIQEACAAAGLVAAAASMQEMTGGLHS